MPDTEERIRERAYQLWEQAGRPAGRSEEFWFAARAEIEGGTPPIGDRPAGAIDHPPQERTLEEPPVVAAQEGRPIGRPGERIAEQGVIDEGTAIAATPATKRGSRATRSATPSRKTGSGKAPTPPPPR